MKLAVPVRVMRKNNAADLSVWVSLHDTGAQKTTLKCLNLDTKTFSALYFYVIWNVKAPSKIVLAHRDLRIARDNNAEKLAPAGLLPNTSADNANTRVWFAVTTTSGYLPEYPHSTADDWRTVADLLEQYSTQQGLGKPAKVVWFGTPNLRSDTQFDRMLTTNEQLLRAFPKFQINAVYSVPDTLFDKLKSAEFLTQPEFQAWCECQTLQKDFAVPYAIIDAASFTNTNPELTITYYKVNNPVIDTESLRMSKDPTLGALLRRAKKSIFSSFPSVLCFVVLGDSEAAREAQKSALKGSTQWFEQFAEKTGAPRLDPQTAQRQVFETPTVFFPYLVPASGGPIDLKEVLDKLEKVLCVAAISGAPMSAVFQCVLQEETSKVCDAFFTATLLKAGFLALPHLDFSNPDQPSFSWFKENVTKRSKKRYAGGFVIESQPGVYVSDDAYNLFSQDAVSFYPSAQCEKQLCLTDPVGLFETGPPDFSGPSCQNSGKLMLQRERPLPAALAKLLSWRRAPTCSAAKKWAIKTISNAGLGLLGATFGRYQAVHLAAAITAWGRYLIQAQGSEIKEKMCPEIAGAAGIVFGITDSFFVHAFGHKAEILDTLKTVKKHKFLQFSDPEFYAVMWVCNNTHYAVLTEPNKQITRDDVRGLAPRKDKLFSKVVQDRVLDALTIVLNAAYLEQTNESQFVQTCQRYFKWLDQTLEKIELEKDKTELAKLLLKTYYDDKLYDRWLHSDLTKDSLLISLQTLKTKYLPERPAAPASEKTLNWWEPEYMTQVLGPDPDLDAAFS